MRSKDRFFFHRYSRHLADSHSFRITYFFFFSFQVLAVTSDKAGPNLRLAAMHGNGQAKNIFASGEPRNLYFVSDPPHLVKTLRNNLASSSDFGANLFWVGTEYTTILTVKHQSLLF